jgi:glycosyltransferase involved in cell wall biosynthesis
MYSLVIPVHNEAPLLDALYERIKGLLARLDGPAEVIFINDGSTDQSGAAMAQLVAGDSRFRLIELARNFGHQAAISAGLDHAEGDAVIIMDADLQDPPEVVLDMIDAWKNGGEVVYGVRLKRQGDGLLKKLTATVYYRLLRSLTDIEIPNDAGDFRLVDRKAVLAFRSLREHNRYVRGMFSWIGFRQVAVPFVRHARSGGETKFSWRRMIRFASDGVFGFSTVPIRWIFFTGAFFIVVGAMSAFVALVPGLVIFFGGLQLSAIGVIGQYLTRTYDEARGRPLYIIAAKRGFPGS